MRFECMYCSDCCFFTQEDKAPLLFEDELHRISQLSRKKGFNLKFKEIKILNIRMYRMLIKGYCPFLDRKTNLCTIHECKPLVCKMYPLLYNPITGQVLISRECRWVDEILNKGLKVDLSMFPNELYALKLIIKKIHNLEVTFEINDKEI